MGWLAKIFSSTPPLPVAPGPSVEELRAERLSELLAQLHALDASLADLRRETQRFRAENFCNIGGQMFVRREKLKERVAIDRESERLRQCELRIIQRRSSVLQERARLLAEQEHTQ